MALTIQTVKLHTGRQNPWAYEIPTTFLDTDGKDHNIVLVFKEGKPTEKEIAEMVAFWKAKIEATVDEEPDEVLMKSEVETVLREKGYLTETQEWEDLPEKAKEIKL